LALFGASFGFVEAAVVVYLRTLAEPIRSSAGFSRGEIFPLMHTGLLGPFVLLAKIEEAREAATLIMLAAVALASTVSFRSWLAAFSLIFGAWDLTFYLWLKVMIGWPKSPATWDLLFLVPVPWVGPVIAPSIVAVTLILGGAIGLMREPKRVSGAAWILLVAGGLLIFVSFIWDWRYIVDGGMPRGFPWAIFGAGEIAGIAGLVKAVGTKDRIEP
jgi:hypothetical protein